MSLSKLVTIVALWSATLPGYAQEDSVAHSVTIRDVEVVTHAYTGELRQRGTGHLEWKLSQMLDLPQILGNADPIHYSEMLPGIQTTGELRSGVNIQGCDNSHSRLSMAGVPIYNVSHLLGIFSTFNAPHFTSMLLSKNPSTAQEPNYLGGTLTMALPLEIADSVHAELSIGMITSQGTLHLPLGARTQLTLSGRASYLNALSRAFLTDEELGLRYSFYDANATLTHQWNEQHTLVLNYYGGADDGTLRHSDYASLAGARWGNQVASLHHLYQGDDWQGEQKLYLTRYSNTYRLSMEETRMKLPSSITDLGYRAHASHDRWAVGAEATYHIIDPQRLETGQMQRKQSSLSWKSRTLEASLTADYHYPMGSRLYLDLGIRGTLYGSETTGWRYSADPSCTLRYNDGTFQSTLGYATRHQYLFQTGFTDLGLPSEFWLSATRAFPPQWAHIYWAGASSYLLNRMFHLEVDLFYRQMQHPMEYTGAITDLYSTEYHLEDCVSQGSGRNYGFSVMLNKCSGAVTGWINYTYTRARRTFDNPSHPGTYPANHERPHELDAVLTYAPGRHWRLGATYVYASGTPFTAPVSVSVINGNLITRYGSHNANRLHAYSRLDLSVVYRWHSSRRVEQGINLSAYNATAHSNELFYYVSVHEDDTYAYRPFTFFVKVLPSLSYYMKF